MATRPILDPPAGAQAPDPNQLAGAALAAWEQGAFAPVYERHFRGRDDIDWITLRHLLFVEILSPAAIAAGIARHHGPAAAPLPLAREFERASWQHVAGQSPPAAAAEADRGKRRHLRRRRLWRAARGLASLRRGGQVPGVIVTQASLDGQGDPNWGPLLASPELGDWLRVDFSYTGPGRADRSPRLTWDTLLLAAMIRRRGHIRRTLSALEADANWQDAIAALVVADVPLGQLCKEAISRHLLAAAGRTMQANLAAEALWRKVQAPVLAVYRERMPPACQIARAGRRRGARVVALQHGDLVEHLSIDLLPPPPEPWQPADVNCVFGTRYRDLLVDQGVYTPDQLAVTGTAWHHGRAMPKRDPKGPLLVLSTTFRSSACRHLYHTRVAGALAGWPQGSYVVKLHPMESAYIPTSGLYPAGTKCLLGRQTLNEALDGCSAVVGSTTFAVMESAMLGFPAVTVALPGESLPARPELNPLLTRVTGPAGPLSEALAAACRLADGDLAPARAAMQEYLAADPAGQNLLGVLAPSSRPR